MMMYRRFQAPTVWDEMDRIQREMNRLYRVSYPRRYQAAPSFPAMNVWSNDEGLVVTAEVPGINPKDIELSVVEDTLTVSGKRDAEQAGEDAKYLRQERGYGEFTRSMQLPFAVAANKVEASFKNGVLNVSLPRKEEDKPRKIKVKVA
jgi:HSP20 family protein